MVDLHGHGSWTRKHPESQASKKLLLLIEFTDLCCRNLFDRVLALKMTSHKAK
jgi:hypothetical protein